LPAINAVRFLKMKRLLIASLSLTFAVAAFGQSRADTLLQEVTLEQAVDYSLKHQPVILQAQIDEEITESNIRSRLADWYPQ
jgi:outer membrane protein